MSNDQPVWVNDIETFFTAADAGCMADDGGVDDVKPHRAIDLRSYQSVFDYIMDPGSPGNKSTILGYLKDGTMPQGGPKWDDDTYKRFEAWVEGGCPWSVGDLLSPPIISG